MIKMRIFLSPTLAIKSCHSSIHPDEHDVSIKDEEERRIPDVQLTAASPEVDEANGDEKSSLISSPLPTALPPKYSP